MTELRIIIKKSINEEMCMTVEDFLSRRTRQLLLNAREAIERSKSCKIMAIEMKKNEDWIQQQISILILWQKTIFPFNQKHSGGPKLSS